MLIEKYNIQREKKDNNVYNNDVKQQKAKWKSNEKEVDKEMQNILYTFPYQTHFGRILNVSGTSL